jgi:hypothetical protein
VRENVDVSEAGATHAVGHLVQGWVFKDCEHLLGFAHSVLGENLVASLILGVRVCD